LKTLFNLQSGKEIGSEHTLLLEAGSNYCCRAYVHKANNAIDGLQFVSFNETEAEDSISQLVNEKEKSVQNAVVCSAFSQALLVPNKFFNDDYSMLDFVYGQPAQAYFHDAISEWQLTNVYAMPLGIFEAVQGSFSSVQFLHAYTPAIKVYNGYVADSQINVHFSAHDFRVLLKKNSAIQLAQTYGYKTPLDVVYYLLKISYEFNLAPQDVQLILSGLIEKDSALFTELRQYFNNVHFTHPPEMKLPDDGHPPHFFTSLYNLASCAS
jgi:hypothetical protein